MPVRRRRYGLLGRRNECEALDLLVANVRSGRSGVLVLHGEAGIGKTALLDYAASRAVGCRLIRAAGVESEMELAFGGLHQLCVPLLERLELLPSPQRDALGTAFGLNAGEVPDRFLVGLAVLSLLGDVAEDQPLLCIVDDAQWLDRVSAQTIAFVARRLLAEPVGLLLAQRDQPGADVTRGLPQLGVSRLGDADARALLRRATPGPLDARVRDRILAEAHGNPLAVLELPRGSTAAELAGGFERPDTRPLTSQIEQSFLARVRALPVETQRLLLVAAADPVGDLSLQRRAAERLGIDVAAAAAAEAAGLIERGARVRFRHPLVRSAAYRAATQRDRQNVHRALAEATDAATDPDRRAWHRANAATFADEAVAADLELSADRARARGGVAAAAAFLARAAALTPDAAARGTRALAAARAKHEAGAFDAALELLEAAELTSLDELSRARATLLRGQIMSTSRSASAGLPFLMAAGKQFETLDATLAGETYRDAMYAALTAGRLPADALTQIGTAVRHAPPQPVTTDLLLRAAARVTTDGYAAGAPLLAQALREFPSEDLPADAALGWLPLACRMAHDVWDFEAWSLLSARLVDLARESGALSVLPSALLLRLSNRAFAGDLAGAASLAAEAATIEEATGSGFLPHYGSLVLEARRGREAATQQAIEAITHDFLLQGEGKVLSATQWAAAVLYNGLGRYEEAYRAAQRGCENPRELGLSTQSMVELVEAAARLGRSGSAAESVRRINEMAVATGTDWALGTAARVRALVSEGSLAESSYREAIERLGNTEVGMELARTRLCYGEWLRRANRRAEARDQLSKAHQMFDQFGAEAFAERARGELLATGATVPRRSVATHTALTAQEAHIALLARAGLTNSEIGAQLFLSRHTVEWHLRKVFAKLGITSRRQLSSALPGSQSAATC